MQLSTALKKKRGFFSFLEHHHHYHDTLMEEAASKLVLERKHMSQQHKRCHSHKEGC